MSGGRSVLRSVAELAEFDPAVLRHARDADDRRPDARQSDRSPAATSDDAHRAERDQVDARKAGRSGRLAPGRRDGTARDRSCRSRVPGGTPADRPSRAGTARDLERVRDVEVQHVVDLDRVAVALHADDQTVQRAARRRCRPIGSPAKNVGSQVERRGRASIVPRSLPVLAAADPERAVCRPVPSPTGVQPPARQRRECSQMATETAGGDQEMAARLHGTNRPIARGGRPLPRITTSFYDVRRSHARPSPAPPPCAPRPSRRGARSPAGRREPM